MSILFLFLTLILIVTPPAYGETILIDKSSLDKEWVKVAGIGQIEFNDEGFAINEKSSPYVEILYDLTDFSLSFDVNVQEYGTYGIVYLSLHQQDNYMGYGISLEASRTSVSARHGYWNDYTWITSMNSGIKVGEWHNVLVTCKDQIFTIYINDKKVGHFEDKNKQYLSGSIAIKASNSTMQFKNVKLQSDTELKLKPTPKIPNLTTDRKPEPNAIISGTFLSLDFSNAKFDPGSWEEEFTAMKKLGMDLIVVRPYVSDMKDPMYPVLDELFAEANRQGIKVMLGSYSNRNYQWTNLGKKVLEESLKKVKSDLDALYDRYGDNEAFYGWYIADEIDEKDLVSTRFDTTTWYYSEQVNYMKYLTPNKPILLSPSYDANATSPSWWAKKYDEFLEIVKIDILGPQDSIGAQRSTPELSALFYGGFAEAAKKHNVILWADVEIFDIKTWHPAPIELVKQQLFAVEPHVEKVIIFEFNHYMNPYRSARTRILYEDYLAWLK